MDCCGLCENCAWKGDSTILNVTVGRRKRKRKPGAGSSVRVKPHTRSPRGPNAGKRRVRVDPYARGKPPKKGRRKRSR